MLQTELTSLTPMQTKVLMHDAWNQGQFVRAYAVETQVGEYQESDGLPKDAGTALRVLRALAEKGMVKHYPEAVLVGGSDNDYLITEAGIQWRVDHAVTLYKAHLAQQLWSESEREEALEKVKVVFAGICDNYSRSRLEINSHDEPMSDKEYRALRDQGWSSYDLEEDGPEEMQVGYVTQQQALAVAAAFGVTLS